MLSNQSIPGVRNPVNSPALSRVLDHLGDIKRAGHGWLAKCPAHEDHKASLSIGLNSRGDVLLHCFAGCAVENIVTALGLTLADLYVQPFAASENSRNGMTGDRISVEALARDKGLPESFLRSLGINECEPRGVRIPYRLPDGSPAPRCRFRRALKAGEGSQWLPFTGSDESLVPYGLDRLQNARQAGYLVLVEGESDCWTLWYHSFPALGIPGASMASLLQAEHLEGIPRLYITQESDAGGKVFVDGVAKRLTELGWPGEAYLIPMPEGIKDPNELHKRGPDDFKRVFGEMLKNAEPLPEPSESASWTIPWPDPLGEDALYGLAGDIVRTIEPHTEADPVGLLVQFLAAFGNIIGRCAHFRVEDTKHFANLYGMVVGVTAKARKGTAWSRVRRVFELAEQDPWTTAGASGDEMPWLDTRLQDGLSSGEGLIWAVRDPSGEDPGVRDKRLLVLQGEFASVLRILAREGNTLSPTIRNAWDTGDLRILTKNAPAQATGGHISIIGHVTKAETLRYLDATEMANGFGNRFLWVCVRRSKCLPEGGHLREEDLLPLVDRLRQAIRFASQAGEIVWDDDARRLWAEVYPALSEGKPGLLGAILARAEAQVTRLAMVYALLDCSPVIRECHLRAALALWRYCDQSARFIFGATTGDPVADKILRTLRDAPDGLTRTEIRDLFGRNEKGPTIEKALRVLEEWGLAGRRMITGTGGRASERWFAIGA